MHRNGHRRMMVSLSPPSAPLTVTLRVWVRLTVRAKTEARLIIIFRPLSEWNANGRDPCAALDLIFWQGEA